MKANCLLTINPDSTNQLALLRKVNPRASASKAKRDSHQMIALIGVSYLKKGGDLLSRLVDSTIGATGLNFSVRNGKRWNPGAITT